MSKSYLIAVIALTFLMTQCSPGSKISPGVYVNNQKLNGRSFHKLFVEVETVDVELRMQVEKELVEALTTQGYAGVKSIDLIPFSLKELKLPAEEEIKQKAKESGCDGILLISLSRNGETVTYMQGADRKENKQIGASLLGGALKQTGEVKPIPALTTQGSFSHTPANFNFKSSLFDLPAAELMFSVVADRIDIASPERPYKTYATRLVEQLRVEKLLK